MMRFCYYTCFCFCLSIYNLVNAQTSIRNFSLQQSGANIKVSFTIVSRQYCTGYEIRRSGDSNEFELIYNASSLCAENTNPVSVVFYDDNPIKNSISYYQIHVPPSSFSSVESITYNESPVLGYILYDNPVNETFKLKINSPYTLLELFNDVGRKVLSLYTDANGMIHENIELLPDGIYYFLIKTQDNSLLKGKLIKVH